MIVGEGDDRPRLEALARAKSPSGSIEFKGFLSRSELNRCYAAASLFVLPSRGEGFGVVYLEAMAHGLACVGSTEDAASEVIVHGETGLLVDPNADALVESIAGLLADPARAAAFGDAGCRRVSAEFSYERFRERMAAMLRAKLAGASEPSQ
jgi:phosphatidylinositol alpha-1,6-mannosyltransferase